MNPGPTRIDRAPIDQSIANKGNSGPDSDIEALQKQVIDKAEKAESLIVKALAFGAAITVILLICVLC